MQEISRGRNLIGNWKNYGMTDRKSERLTHHEKAGDEGVKSQTLWERSGLAGGRQKVKTETEQRAVEKRHQTAQTALQASLYLFFSWLWV